MVVRRRRVERPRVRGRSLFAGAQPPDPRGDRRPEAHAEVAAGGGSRDPRGMTLRRLAPWALATALAASHAEAFCGFYVSGSGAGLTNKATRAALMRSGTRTVLTMSNDYDGPPEDFAMVVPVPVVLSRDNVRTLPHDVFEHLEALTAPRLVEYWEQDPCPHAERGEVDRMVMSMPGVALTAESTISPDVERHVRVEARFAVGEYEVVVLSADESSALESWLRGNRYNIPRGASDALAPYVRGGWKFFVARVDLARAQRRPDGGARLSPLRMQYDSEEFRLPVRLGLLNAPPGPQDLIVYVLHPSARFEVTNYRNVFIPTNLDLVEGARDRFASLYGALFDATVESAGKRAVVTEYAWSTGGCDPCPSPPLDANDLATLGTDRLRTLLGDPDLGAPLGESVRERLKQSLTSTERITGDEVADKLGLRW